MKKIFTVILVILLILSIGGNVFLTKIYFKAKDEIKTAQQEKEELNTKIEQITKEKTTSDEKLTEITKDYEELSKKYDEIVELYNKECAVEYEEPQDLSEYATDISYDDLSRTPDEFAGKAVCFEGKVVQLLEGEEFNNLRIAINGDYDKMIYLEYEPNITPVRVLEDDNIVFYGIYYGIYQYESTLGSMISVPAVMVDHIEIK